VRRRGIQTTPPLRPAPATPAQRHTPTLGARPSRKRDRYTTQGILIPQSKLIATQPKRLSERRKGQRHRPRGTPQPNPCPSFITPFAAGDAAPMPLTSLPALASSQRGAPRPELSVAHVARTGLGQITRHQLYRLSVCSRPPAMQPWPTRKIWRAQWRWSSGCHLGTRPEAHSRGHVLQKHGNNWVRGTRRNGG
jgi:hypothetical protein